MIRFSKADARGKSLIHFMDVIFICMLLLLIIYYSVFKFIKMQLCIMSPFCKILKVKVNL
jgi:hypothetical protein